MATEDFDAEEWDDEFLDQLVQAEEQAISSRLPSSFRYEPPQSQRPHSVPCELSYSPPRQLTQRSHDASFFTASTQDGFAPNPTNAPHLEQGPEFLKLQKELERVTKELTHREKECAELRKERDKREQELKEQKSRSRMELKDAALHLGDTSEISAAPRMDIAPKNTELSANKLQSCSISYDRVGEETDKSNEAGPSSVQNVSCRSENLFGVWNSDKKNDRRALVAKLYVNCEADFHVLFGYLNTPQNENTPSTYVTHLAQPTESIKVSRLYSVLAKIGNGDSMLGELLEALSALCSSKNVFIVHGSLHILHMILSTSFGMEGVLIKRESFPIDRPYFSGCRNSRKESLSSEDRAEFHVGTLVSNFNTFIPNGHSAFSENQFGDSVPVNFWVSLFEHMCQITLENKEERVLIEAASIMNLILMRHKAYYDRDEFAKGFVFKSLSQLLKKEAGLSVQNQAIHALYLLCNCPKVTDMLFSGVEKGAEQSCSGNENKDTASVHLLHDILTGLADCLSSDGSTSEEKLKLRRHAVVFLAFLGSSGRPGIEMWTSLLAIILQGLVSDLHLLDKNSGTKPGVCRELTWLIREALIFLNRLVAHPQHAGPVLHALTSTLLMASMTVEFAARLTQQSRLLWRENSMTKQIRESEIIELAQIFQRRVLAFMGDSIP